MCCQATFWLQMLFTLSMKMSFSILLLFTKAYISVVYLNFPDNTIPLKNTNPSRKQSNPTHMLYKVGGFLFFFLVLYFT